MKGVLEMKRLFAAGLSLFLAASFTCMAAGQEGIPTAQSAEATDQKGGTVQVTVPVSEDTQFGSVLMEMSPDEFEESGFQYGDSCNVAFSNGYTMEDLPYYSGYYAKVNSPLVVGYPMSSNVCIAFCWGDSMWERTGCQPGDTVTVTLAESGRYADVQDNMDLFYDDDRSDYPDDETFCNFREVRGGNLRPETLYRGATGVDNVFGRASYVDSLLEKHGIRCVLNLADDPEEAKAHMDEPDFNSPYYKKLYDEGNVIAVGLSAAYRQQEFMEKLAGGFRQMLDKEGPFYIHCTEGKDRAGFVCLLLGALAGSGKEELEADYMKTYDNYFGVSAETDPARYETVKDLYFEDMYAWLCSVGQSMDMSIADPQTGARAYLRNGGMTKEEIDAFVELLASE